MPKKPSAARRLCKFCKIWIADNRIQIQQHEQAKKHKEAVKALLKEIADKNEKREKEQVINGPNIGGTYVTERASTAAVQLLESAIGTSVKGTIRAPKINTTRSQHNADSNGVSQGADESLDADGYPLPAHTFYGPWESVPESNTDQVRDEDPTAQKDNNEGQSLPEDAALEEEAEWNDSATVFAKKRMEPEDDNDFPEEVNENVQVLFKKRSAPRNRRARKKARR